MGFFGFLSKSKINEYVKEAEAKNNSYILDVRTEEEYDSGHIPGSINIPLQKIDKVKIVIKDKSSHIYVYCQSGARSSQSVGFLKNMGYRDVINMGGIVSYNGAVE